MKSRRTVRIKTDLTTRFCLAAITVLLTVLVVGLWVERVPSVEPAQAQMRPQKKGPFVSSSTQSQLVELVNLQKQTNAKLDQIAGVLTSGQIKVEVVQDDKAKGDTDEKPKPRIKK